MSWWVAIAPVTSTTSQANTYKTASTPATEFGYIDFTPQNGEFTPITRENAKELPALNETGGYDLVDLFGEGTARHLLQWPNDYLLQ